MRAVNGRAPAPRGGSPLRMLACCDRERAQRCLRPLLVLLPLTPLILLILSFILPGETRSLDACLLHTERDISGYATFLARAASASSRGTVFHEPDMPLEHRHHLQARSSHQLRFVSIAPTAAKASRGHHHVRRHTPGRRFPPGAPPSLPPGASFADDEAASSSALDGGWQRAPSLPPC